MKPATTKALTDISAALTTASDNLNDAIAAGSIDWTNVKKMIGQLLRQFLPLLLPFFLNLIDPPPPTP